MSAMDFLIGIIKFPVFLFLLYINVFLQQFDDVSELISYFIPWRWGWKKMKKEVVLITGAGEGLGRMLAVKFAEKGSQVVLWDVNKKANDDTAKLVREKGGVAHTYVVDLRKREEIYKTADLTRKEVNHVTVLVNAASTVANRDLINCSDYKIQKIFELNVLAQIWTVKAFLPFMKQEKKGHIVSIASLSGMSGLTRVVDYLSSSYSSTGFEDALHAELRAKNMLGYIKTTVVNPYFMSAAMFSGEERSFIPFLSPDRVARKIVNAVEHEHESVTLPRFMILIMYLKRILPRTVTDYLVQILSSVYETVHTIKTKKDLFVENLTHSSTNANANNSNSL